mmetsp:Transcript_13156/g.30011  ORF Transcript_13156/g.30011 Transcript_13156/m.30011 type:complete len:296 (+) Transcript_13156:442-1329(+)
MSLADTTPISTSRWPTCGVARVARGADEGARRPARCTREGGTSQASMRIEQAGGGMRQRRIGRAESACAAREESGCTRVVCTSYASSSTAPLRHCVVSTTRTSFSIADRMTAPHHTIPHRTTPRHIAPSHAAPHHTTPHRITPYRTARHHATAHCTTRHAAPNYAMPHRAAWRTAPRAAPRCTTLHCVTPHHSTPRRTTPRHAALHHTPCRTEPHAMPQSDQCVRAAELSAGSAAGVCGFGVSGPCSGVVRVSGMWCTWSICISASLRWHQSSLCVGGVIRLGVNFLSREQTERL